MNTTSQKSTNGGRRWIAALAAIGLLIWFGDVQAAAISTAARSGDAAHSCKCGPRCRGEVCCCLPDEPPKPARPAKDLDDSLQVEPTESNDGPCLAVACSDPAGPTSRSVGPVKAAATVADLDARQIDLVGLLALPASPGLPARLATRLERPPKADASA